MNNKIALALDEIHQIAFEEGQPADNGDGYLFNAEEFDFFVQRLFDSADGSSMDPVPPAGVEVEIVAWANWKVGTKSYIPFRSKEEASRSVDKSELAAIQLGPYKVVGLVDRAHVTQLQAEVDKWKLAVEYHKEEASAERDVVETVVKEKRALQSELTKARELIQKISDTACGYLPEIKEYLSNQSAPADKG